MNSLYPIYLKLAGKPVLVVGGGPVARRRVERLIEAGAVVTVVSPVAVAGLRDLRDSGRLQWIERKFDPCDLAGAALVYLAAGDAGLVESVRRETEARGIWLSAADDEAASDFHVPAVHTRGDVKVAVSTGGLSPAGAVRIRDAIAAWLAERPDVVDDSLAAGRGERGSPAPGVAGKVFLVGAGPGDPGLLTLRAAELLASAHVVYYDRLVSDAILARISPQAERIYVGKEAGCSLRADIEKLLVESARAGKRVVRLKGGDPLIFGRGGEEMAALHRSGVEFEIVPGVSALNAVPAAAGIPLTLRGVASEIVVRSGHACKAPPRKPSSTDAQHTTYVYFMAGTRLAQVAQELTAEGVGGTTPVAVVMRGTLPGQRTLTYTVAELASAADLAAIDTPALVVVGEVVRARGTAGLLELLDSSQETREFMSQTRGTQFHA